MIAFYKNKANFIFVFYEEEISFIFEDNQYNKILPILKLNEKKNINLSIGIMLKYYIKKGGAMIEKKLISNKENMDKEKTWSFISFFKVKSGIIYPNNIQILFNSFDPEKIEKKLSKKFVTSNLFLMNNSIIPKMWIFLFSFKDDSDVLNYIIDNLLPFEREIFKIVNMNFFKNLIKQIYLHNIIFA